MNFGEGAVAVIVCRAEGGKKEAKRKHRRERKAPPPHPIAITVSGRLRVSSRCRDIGFQKQLGGGTRSLLPSLLKRPRTGIWWNIHKAKHRGRKEESLVASKTVGACFGARHTRYPKLNLIKTVAGIAMQACLMHEVSHLIPNCWDGKRNDKS